jgi:HEPN domain-containing protein
MDKQAELRQWIEIADSDLSAARHMLNTMWPVPYAIVCFHCQQAAEKYLKWVLVLHDIDPPKIHDLEELEKLCEAIIPQFDMLYEKCAALTEYAVPSRYPNENQLEKNDMDRALEYAQSIREFVQSHFPEQFALYDIDYSNVDCSTKL